MSIFQYATDPTIIDGQYAGDAALQTPLLFTVGQASGIVVASVGPPTLIPISPVAGIKLYIANADGSYTFVDERDSSPESLWTNVFDLAPKYGITTTYVATALYADGTESAYSNTLPFNAIKNPFPIRAARGLSPAAFGPYPLLGSDVYLHPVLREGVVGPNGDLLTVNGLELLAQDLTIRILTEIGELPLQQNFGFVRGRLIGSGQSDPVAMAQMLRTRIIDAIMADKRVDTLDDIVITQPNFDGWLISYTVYAIGVEDPLKGNLVYPYFLAS